MTHLFSRSSSGCFAPFALFGSSAHWSIGSLANWLIGQLAHWAIGSFSLLLLLAAESSIALGLSGLIRGLDSALLLTVTTCAVLFSWFLARTRLPGLIGLLAALAAGIAFVLVRVGQLGGPLILFMRALGDLAWTALDWRIGRAVPSAELAQVALYQFVSGFNTLMARVGDWLGAFARSVPAFDPVAVALVWSMLIWIVTSWAAWFVRRASRPFEGILPGIAVLGAILAYTGGNALFLLPLLGGLLLLMVIMSASLRERHWNVRGVDYAEDIRPELIATGVTLSLLLLATAWVTQSFSIVEIARRSQQWLTQPAPEANRLPDSFGLVLQPRPTTVFDAARAPGLPRQHLIGAGPELSKQWVMNVAVSDLLPSGRLPRFYWQSSTYDRYNGQGWSTSPTADADYAAGAQIGGVGVSQQRIRQLVTTSGGGLVYAAGTLVSVNQNLQLAWRSQEVGDYFAAYVRADTYRVDSVVSSASELELRAAGTGYPDWVRSRYLQLPDDIPERVPALARDLTATAPTPYDRARALETYLRQFPYTLDLPAPPPNRDIVDYFLFDLQRGYCDYYATAMVVLARAAGLPARLVVGYAAGTFDPARASYSVTEADAHSWAEVYFPNYDWIPFEPTGGRDLLERPGIDSLPERHPNPPTEISNPRVVSQVDWRLALPGGILLCVVGLVSWVTLDRWRLRRLAPEAAIARIYRRLLRYLSLLGVIVHAADTPNEIADRLAQRLTRASHAEQEVRWLTAVYVEGCYSPHAPSRETQVTAIRVFDRLRLRLLRLWIDEVYRRVVRR